MEKIFFLAAAALILTACDNNEDNVVTTSPVAAQITATIGESLPSRASDYSWTPGDTIGISTTVGTKAGPFVNIKYITHTGGGVFTGNPIYIYNPMKLTAYYPFTGIEGTAPGTITATTDAEDQKNQPTIDFLYASKEGITSDDPKVKFEFAHKMSKITLIFINDTDGTADVSKITSYEIGGLVLKGTFNTADGTAMANNDVMPAPLKINVSSVASGVSVAPVIIFPQAIREKVTLTITDSDNQVYACELNPGASGIVAGKNYQFTVTVSKTKLTLNESTIANWNKEELNAGANSDLSQLQ